MTGMTNEGELAILTVSNWITEIHAQWVLMGE